MDIKLNKSVVNRRTLAKGAVVSIVAANLGHIAQAQDASPVPGGPPPMAEGVGMEVLLEGLLDPRFIAVDGTDVYFTESGSGGDEGLMIPAGEGTPEATAPSSMHGPTGKLSKLAADGTLTELVTDFRSYTFGDHGEIVGAAGLALDGAGSAYVSVGAPGPFVGMMPRTGEEGVVYKVDLATGDKEVVADLLQWELDENPDPMAIDSNLYGAAFLDGVVYVADAGGNDILAIDTAADNAVSTFAVTGGLPAPFLPASGNPARGGELEIDSVPSTIKVGPDGRLYVSFVSGGPFPAGIVPVDAYSTDGTMETVAEGLTMVSDVAFDSMGRMYVATISTDFINQAPGQIVRIEEDGSQTLIAVAPVPAGIAFDADDNLYAAIFSAVAPMGGSLVRYTGVGAVAAAASSPEASPVMDAGSASVTLVDGEIQPAALTIAADTDVTISVMSDGTIGHNFTIEDQDLATTTLDPGTSEDLVVNLPAGTYTYFCSVPGHREAGMVGTLTVE